MKAAVCGRLLPVVAAAMLAAAVCSTAATVLKEADASQPPGPDPVLRVEFLLPEAEAVSSVTAMAGANALEPGKVKFTPVSGAPDQRCAILLLVDNTPDMGDYLPQIRLSLQKFASSAETAPYEIGIGTFSDDVQMLVPIGGKTADLKSPDMLKKIDGTGPSTEIYLCAQHAIPMLEQTKAARRFLVIISNGRGEDKKYTHDETVKAALAAKVRICTIGYAQPQGDNPSYLQTLTKLSEETGGYKGRANVSTRELPANFETNLLKYAGSGGTAEVALAGLTAPLTVALQITTESGKEYVFSQKVESFAAQTPEGKPENSGKAPKPEDNPDQPAADPKPEKTGGTQPAAPAGLFERIKRQIKERPDLAAIGGGAALITLLLLILALRRMTERGAPVLPPEAPPAVAPQFVIPEAEPRGQAPDELPVLAWLESLDAEQTRHAIRKAAVRIGRKDDNDISLRNDSVSHYHAEVLKRGEQFLITDLGASNGVYINHKRVEKSQLEHNDLLELGEVRFRFLLPDSPTPNP